MHGEPLPTQHASGRDVKIGRLHALVVDSQRGDANDLVPLGDNDNQGAAVIVAAVT